MRPFFFCITTVAVVLAAGCGSSPAEPAKTASDQPKGGDASSAAEVGPASSPPEEASGPARSFAELQKAALACKFEEGSFDSSCEGYQAFFEDGPAFEEGKANPELLKMVTSGDPKTRRLGAERLRTTTTSENVDAKTADLILEASAKERDEHVIQAMAELAAGLDLVKVGRVEQAIKIAKEHPLEAYGDRFMFEVGFINHHKALAAWAREVATSQSSTLRNSALQLLSKLATDLPDDTCATIDTLRSDKDNFVKWRATSVLAESRGCSAHFGKLVTALSAVDVKKDVNQNVGFALLALCKNQSLDQKLRDKAGKAAKRITEATAVSAGTRFYTLDAVVQCDPKDGRAFVAKFKGDKEKLIAERAAELTK